MIDRKRPAQEEDAIVGSKVLEHKKTSTDIVLNDLNVEPAVASNDINEEKKVAAKDDSHSAAQLHSKRGQGSPQKRSWSTKLNPFKKSHCASTPRASRSLRRVSNELRFSTLLPMDGPSDVRWLSTTTGADGYLERQPRPQCGRPLRQFQIIAGKAQGDPF
jgi:hypothetical protein